MEYDMYLVLVVLLSFVSQNVFSQTVTTFEDWEKSIIEPQLYGGRPAVAGELPHVYWLGFCTATLVSTKAVITAAHCVDNGQRISFKKRDGQTINGVCRQHPRYDDNGYTNNDFALCKITPEITDVVRASISTEMMLAGQRVVANGYGRPNITVLHVGESVIRSAGAQDYTTRGLVALGGGDSGGSLFKGPIADLKVGPFEVVGINSRREVNGQTSFYNITALPRSVDFFKSYAATEKIELCGINANCSVKPPSVPDECLDEKALLEYFEGETKAAKLAFDACVKSL
jgi:hypothetical protein